jgi:hypothetical protein
VTKTHPLSFSLAGDFESGRMPEIIVKADFIVDTSILPVTFSLPERFPSWFNRGHQHPTTHILFT